MPLSDDLDGVLDRTRDLWRELAGNRIFLTGATGFFGAWLLSTLAHANRRLDAGVSAVVLSRDPNAFARRAPELAADPGIALWAGDVRSFRFPTGAFDRVIHGATDTSREAAGRPDLLSETIVQGTRRVLDFAVQSGARQVLLTSSGAVYGAQPAGMERLRETYPGAPLSESDDAVYGLGKRLAEALCIARQREAGVEAKIARCFAFVGPHMPLDGHFALGNFIGDVLAGRRIVVKGDGTPVRSYLYAADLAAWLWTILVQGRAGVPYNVGSDQAVTIAELARTVVATLSAGTRVEVAGASGDGRRQRYVPDIQRARSELGLEAWTPLHESIRRTARWAGRPRTRSAPPAPPEPARSAHRTFVVDIDGVVATLTPDNDYNQAQPITRTIEAINRLYRAGHRIVMFTARGYVTGLDWRETTARQLDAWGLRYHELKMGKPAADHYVDDRFITLESLHDMAEEASAPSPGDDPPHPERG